MPLRTIGKVIRKEGGITIISWAEFLQKKNEGGDFRPPVCCLLPPATDDHGPISVGQTRLTANVRPAQPPSADNNMTSSR